MRKSGEQRILLQARGEDALGREEHRRRRPRTAARSGRASRPRRRSSSPARRRCARRGCARPRAAAAARSPGRPRRAPAARASSCPRPAPPSRPRRGTRGPARGSREEGHRSGVRAAHTRSLHARGSPDADRRSLQARINQIFTASGSRNLGRNGSRAITRISTWIARSHVIIRISESG